MNTEALNSLVILILGITNLLQAFQINKLRNDTDDLTAAMGITLSILEDMANAAGMIADEIERNEE